MMTMTVYRGARIGLAFYLLRLLGEGKRQPQKLRRKRNAFSSDENGVLLLVRMCVHTNTITHYIGARFSFLDFSFLPIVLWHVAYFIVILVGIVQGCEKMLFVCVERQAVAFHTKKVSGKNCGIVQ